MRKILFITSIILLIPILFAQECNTKCIESGYSSGICSNTCDDITIGRADDCAVKGEAFLVIGTEAIDTYTDQDPFIGENSTDPDWKWIIKNIRTKSATNILDTDDDSQHSGPIIGIKNDFIATDIDDIDVKAKKAGESFCFPGNVICINFKTLTISNYATYTIQKTTVDLSSFNSTWTNKISILLHSTDSDGLKIQTADFDDPASGADGSTTDNIWIIYNDTGAYAGVFYEDSSNTKKLAGYINMDNPNDDINIADVNYKKTLNDNVQIDLRGNFSVADNLDIVLDILAEEGDASTNGNDDITINLKHSADSDFDGYGNSSGTADDADLVWVSTNIGTKDEDHRTLYGIIIKDPKTNNAQDKAIFEIPEDQVKAEIEIKRGKSSITKTKTEQTTVLGEQIPSPILSSELKLKEDFNLILVGGPCINPPLETFEEFPTCKEWPLKRGEAMIKYAKNKNNIALLVAGTTAEDTKMASEFLKNFDQYDDLVGTYIIIRKDQKPEVINPSIADIDFSDFPVPFIKEGKFSNMRLVVGDRSKAEDTIGALAIASGLFSITRRTTEFSNATEESNLSNSQTKEIPLGNQLGDSTFFSKSLNKGDIKTLLKQHLTLSGKDINFREIILLYNGGPTIATSLSSSDDNYGSEVYMEVTSGDLRYYYVFQEEIDLKLVTADTSLTINFLDNKIAITDAETATKFKSQSATKYFMRAGDKATIENQEVELIDIDKNGAVVVKVNNTEEIIAVDKYEIVEGLKIKNVEAFDIEGSTCCCTDLLSGLL